MYPQLPAVAPRPCPHHNQPLDLFCQDDKECVCEKELVQMQAEVQRRVQETEKKLKELPHFARQHKALVQALEQESTDLFSELVKNVNYTGIQVGELLSTHETSLGSQIEGQIHRLEQEVVQLRWKSEELSRLADMQDHICFLKNFLIMEPLGKTGATGELILTEDSVVASIRSTMKELQESIQDLCKASLDKIITLVNDDPVASTPNGAAAVAAGTTAADKHGQATTQNSGHEDSTKSSHLLPACPLVRFEPTLDPNTVYRHVLLSDGGHKATMQAENLKPTDHPERFLFWRQVLCREPLAGSPYYWEVEWTGQKITIGVAYKEMEREGSDDKSRLGHNPLSWSLYWSGTGFSFWHDGQEKLLGSPKARRVGIYLDQHAGILAFYRIVNNQADLIHKHQTQFNGPLYPGFRFWAGIGSTVTVCQLD
eukprot:superscaffoldBa00000015_g307